jgi:hypothetical protein
MSPFPEKKMRKDPKKTGGRRSPRLTKESDIDMICPKKQIRA